MAEIITHYLDEFIRKDYECINLGFKPSGRLHTGSVLTLVQAFLYAKQHPEAQVEVGVMDLDYDQRLGDKFRSYFLVKDRETGELMKDITMRELEQLTEDITEVMGLDRNPANIRLFSDTLKTSTELLDMITLMARDSKVANGVKRAIYDNSGKSFEIPLSGVCGECEKSNTGHSRVNRNTMELTSRCLDKECPVESYDFTLDQIGRYNVHYLIDPIRDLCDQGQAQVGAHLFGGDYALPSGKRKVFKAQRVHNVMRQFAGEAELPDIYVGPLLTHDNLKLSKSHTTISFSDDPLRKDWIQQLIDISKGGDRAVIKYEDIRPSVQPSSGYTNDDNNVGNK